MERGRPLQMLLLRNPWGHRSLRNKTKWRPQKQHNTVSSVLRDDENMTAVGASPCIYTLSTIDARTTWSIREEFVWLPCKSLCFVEWHRNVCEFLRQPCDSLENLHDTCPPSCDSCANVCLSFLTFKLRTPCDPWDRRTSIVLMTAMSTTCAPVWIFCEFVCDLSTVIWACEIVQKKKKKKKKKKNRKAGVKEALTHSMRGKNSTDDNLLKYFLSYFSQEIGFDISCK